jgi:hypothetical protein
VNLSRGPWYTFQPDRYNGTARRHRSVEVRWRFANQSLPHGSVGFRLAVQHVAEALSLPCKGCSEPAQTSGGVNRVNSRCGLDSRKTGCDLLGASSWQTCTMARCCTSSLHVTWPFYALLCLGLHHATLTPSLALQLVPLDAKRHHQP